MIARREVDALVALEYAGWMFVNLMVAVGVMSLAAYLPRKAGPSTLRLVLAGTVLCLFCMAYPFELASGVRLDLRPTPLGLIGWRWGWKWALLPLAAISAVRIWLGGAGVVPALVHAVFCVVVSAFFTGRRRTLASMAAMASIFSLGFFLVMQLFLTPRPPTLAVFSPIWLSVLGTSILSFWAMDLVSEHLQNRRQLEANLERELRSKEAVLELIPHGIIFLGRNQECISMNQAATQLIGGNEAMLRTLLACPDLKSALRRQERFYGYRVSVTESDTVLLVSAVPLPDGGAVLGLENVTQVILQERSGAERERMELLGRLAAMAAHEVKNPLTTIKGFLQLLSGRPEFGDFRSTFGLVQGEVEHISRVVTDFLSLSGHSAMHPERLSADGVLQELLDVMKLQFPAERVAVTLEGDANLLVYADEKALKQILKNLVANAFEAMPDGGSLVIRRERNGNELIITVADSGVGIPEEVLPHIFHPYTTTKATGTGLGLAISHKLATEMGGRLEVTSRVGVGTSFRLALPAHSDAWEAAAAGVLPD